MITTRQQWGLGLVVGLTILNFFIWHEVFLLAGPNYLNVAVLDVGQGDAIFIQTPSRRTFLIDGGPGSAVLGKLSPRLPFWQHRLDAVFLTHPDQDHLLGLLEVLKRYRVDYIFWTGVVRDGANYQEWRRVLDQKKEEGSQIVVVSAPVKITNGGVAMTILNPRENLENQFFSQTNDTGITMRLTYGKNALLLMADTSAKVEKALLDKHAIISAEVLKVAHHGSKYSTSEDFLQAVSPRLAAISVGRDNSYGHPTPEVLQKLEKFGIQTLRTDHDGDIIFKSDGDHITYDRQ